MARRTPQDRLTSRMADIERDYERQVARGKDPAVARAKRRQREADARDDLARRTGGDRTATRTAERESESALTGARRSASGRSPARREALAAATPARGARANVDLGLPSRVTAAAGAPASSGNLRDPLSFGAAFNQAREKNESTFTWRGKSYNTRTREQNARGSGPGTGGGSSNRRDTPAPAARTRQGETAQEKAQRERREAADLAARINESNRVRNRREADGGPRNNPNRPGEQLRTDYTASDMQSDNQRASTYRGLFQRQDGRTAFSNVKGGSIKKMAKGGSVKKSIDGIATRGKTRAPTRKK